eukprot:gene2877-3303_t
MAANKILIKKYLNKECTAAEKLEVERFLRLEEGELVLQEVLEELLPADMEAFKIAVASEHQSKAWKEKVLGKLGISDDRIENQQFKRRPYLNYAAGWAAVVLLAGLAFFGIRSYNNQENNKQNAIAQTTFDVVSNGKGKRSRITLSDGSVINLGADSRLKYPKLFRKNSREVELLGEAFFEITKDKTRPFIVHAGNLQTKVLGTSFKIEAFTGQPFSVAVATGKVRVDEFRGQRLLRNMAILSPGNKICRDPSTGQSEILHQDITEITSWTRSRLVFNAEKLEQIAKQLERWYDVEIQFLKPELARKKVTVTLMVDRPLNDILQVLSAGGGLHYKINAKKITIY